MELWLWLACAMGIIDAPKAAHREQALRWPCTTNVCDSESPGLPSPLRLVVPSSGGGMPDVPHTGRANMKCATLSRSVLFLLPGRRRRWPDDETSPVENTGERDERSGEGHKTTTGGETTSRPRPGGGHPTRKTDVLVGRRANKFMSSLLY